MLFIISFRLIKKFIAIALVGYLYYYELLQLPRNQDCLDCYSEYHFAKRLLPYAVTLLAIATIELVTDVVDIFGAVIAHNRYWLRCLLD